jgi:hypothetical protein
MIEQRFFDRMIRVPVIDLDLSPLQAALAISLVTLTLTIVLMSSLALAKDAEKIEEPWLLLDSIGLLPNTLALVWGVVVVVTARAGAALAMWIEVRLWQLNGLAITGRYEIATVTACGLVELLSIYCGFRVARMLIALRRSCSSRAMSSFDIDPITANRADPQSASGLQAINHAKRASAAGLTAKS